MWIAYSYHCEYCVGSLGPGVHRLIWLGSYLSGTRLTYIAEIFLEGILEWNLPADLRVGWGCRNHSITVLATVMISVWHYVQMWSLPD